MIITANYDGPPYQSPTPRVLAGSSFGLADSPAQIASDAGTGLGTILLAVAVIGGAAWFYTRSRGDKGMLRGRRSRR